jgi:hypothetical protein
MTLSDADAVQPGQGPAAGPRSRARRVAIVSSAPAGAHRARGALR